MEVVPACCPQWRSEPGRLQKHTRLTPMFGFFVAASLAVCALASACGGSSPCGGLSQRCCMEATSAGSDPVGTCSRSDLICNGDETNPRCEIDPDTRDRVINETDPDADRELTEFPQDPTAGTAGGACLDHGNDRNEPPCDSASLVCQVQQTTSVPRGDERADASATRNAGARTCCYKRGAMITRNQAAFCCDGEDSFDTGRLPEEEEESYSWASATDDDSTSGDRGICGHGRLPTRFICGYEGGSCCSREDNPEVDPCPDEVDQWLYCASTRCAACGGEGQPCCPAAESSQGAAIDKGQCRQMGNGRHLQCQSDGATSVCVDPANPKASRNAESVCDAATLGSCQACVGSKDAACVWCAGTAGASASSSSEYACKAAGTCLGDANLPATAIRHALACGLAE